MNDGGSSKSSYLEQVESLSTQRSKIKDVRREKKEITDIRGVATIGVTISSLIVGD